jgi:hypothetical protein
LERPFQAAVGRWIHLIQIWNGQTLTQWVDGRPVESISAAGVLAPGDSPIRIGWDQYYFFKGDIDEVRVYDRALTDDEVRGMYRLGSPGLPNLVGFGRATLDGPERPPFGGCEGCLGGCWARRAGA